uniref:Uncharacterized protein n=1 Tax=Rhizophora mucronata TaxID=61149 RepID=A0A2P2NP18_RHIMU
MACRLWPKICIILDWLHHSQNQYRNNLSLIININGLSILPAQPQDQRDERIYLRFCEHQQAVKPAQHKLELSLKTIPNPYSTKPQ